MNLKIVSFNIHSGVGTDGKFSYERIGKYLASLKPDIVCLQEMDLRDITLDKSEQINALKAGYFQHFIANPAVVEDDGYYGNAILSRFKPESVDALDLSFQNNQPRNVQYAKFVENGYQFIVLNTHFGLQAKERNKQFQQLIELINTLHEHKGKPIFLLGDFNEWMPITNRLNQMNSLLNAVRLEATFPNKIPIFKLDRIWYRGEVKIHSGKVIKNKVGKHYSDHYPVSIECSIGKLNKI